ncbi:hypothetical protein Y11_08581 [Yersinia enterocolitica subsp. palearctica Y11]|uniref:Uncharacterized protein n=1 Tax=Yersinia enterocolitica subsp. palearctica serotype O:3 (strain DSM 13030 / CIP 106945 / Y11) TaxID=930944 RepID=A0A0H3NQK7_YERE1|nr:hypothetical protein Y11_08581 [Yersinia enterocolitica subsp. palearctica Y11]CCO68739.1 hypothetical protein D322_1865 [Yersinia enterocolitica IP 10393]
MLFHGSYRYMYVNNQIIIVIMVIYLKLSKIRLNVNQTNT